MMMMMMILSLKSVTGHHGWGMCRELSSVPPTLSACVSALLSQCSVFTYSQGAQETPELRGVVEYGTCSTTNY